MYIDTATSVLPLVPIFPQTSTEAGYTTTVSLISSHITRAESFVNGMIGSRYDLSGYTATTAPPIVKTITQDLVSYYTIRSLYSADNQNNSEWADRYEDAMDVLKMIRSGDMDIADSSGTIIPTSVTTASIESTTKGFQPTFDERESYRQSIDGDKFDGL